MLFVCIVTRGLHEVDLEHAKFCKLAVAFKYIGVIEGMIPEIQSKVNFILNPLLVNFVLETGPSRSCSYGYRVTMLYLSCHRNLLWYSNQHIMGPKRFQDIPPQEMPCRIYCFFLTSCLCFSMTLSTTSSNSVIASSTGGMAFIPIPSMSFVRSVG